MNSSTDNIEEESQAEARRRQRATQKQKAEGLYEASILERAKGTLREMADPSIENLQAIPEFSGQLDEESVRKLKVFIQNLRAKNKKSQTLSDQMALQEQEFKEKIKSFVNRKIDKLHQSILIQQTEEERSLVILDAIEKNLFDFLEYLDNYPSPSHDFLRIVIGLRDKLDEDSFTSIFVRVCSKIGGDPLAVTSQMVERAMSFLAEVETNQQAAYGLLKLVFINQISLSSFDVDLLLSFQHLYAHAIIRFSKSIGIKDDEIIPLLPATCFIFTTPLLEALKSGGSVLHHRLPPTFLPYLLEIISYSFTEKKSEFDAFLEVMRIGCKRHSHRLLKSDFSQLLRSITQLTISRKPGFFKSLSASTEAIQRAFVLLEEKRIDQFDQRNIDALLCGGEEAFIIMKARPKIVQQQSRQELGDLLADVIAANQEFTFPKLFFDFSFRAQDIPVFNSLGIANLLPIQSLCYQLCMSLPEHGKYFLQYQTGQGKTALCLAVACRLAQNGKIVFVINDSAELTFRDYKKAAEISTDLGIEFNHGCVQACKQQNNPLVSFCTFQDFLATFAQTKLPNPKAVTLIVDEFDSILFERRYHIQVVADLFNKFPHSIAFSGSNLQSCHQSFITKHLGGNLVNLILGGHLPTEAKCSGMQIFLTKKEFKEAIFQSCYDRVKMTPIILVGDEQLLEIKKALLQRGVSVESLFEQPVAALDSALGTFIMRRNGTYAVYLVSVAQGRGIDFPSCSEIEQNGGVHVVVTVMPKFHVQFKQFIGRTARIGNKGTYSVLIFDKDSKNTSPEVYFQKKFGELKNNDVMNLANLQQPEQDDEQSCHEEEKSSPRLAGLKRAHPEMILGEEKMLETDSLLNNEEDSYSKITIIGSSNEKVQSDQIPPSDLVTEHQNQEEKQHLGKRDEKISEKQGLMSRMKKPQAKNELSEIDKLYFKSYEDQQIHSEMLKDEPRMDAYRDAIGLLSKDKVVIDVGAGTGVLSMMAMDFGARCVHAIEKSGIASVAQSEFQKRRERLRMAVYNQLAEDFKIGNSKADLIVSEWMGYFLIYENMLPSVLAVRDRCLKKNGEIIPREAELLVAAYYDSHEAGKLSDPQLDDDEGSTALIRHCPEILLRSTCQTIFKVNLLTVEGYQNEFKSTAKLRIIKQGPLSGLCAWFRCQMAPGVVLDTSPSSKLTHWRQTILPFDTEMEVVEDQILVAEVSAWPQEENHRALNIAVRVLAEDGSTIMSKDYKMN